MAIPPHPTSRDLDMLIANTRQTISILRGQAQTGRIDAKYFDQRLGSVEQLLEMLTEDRKQSSQQQRLAKLYEVSRAIGGSLDLQTVLNQVMDAIISLTGAERGFLMMLDDDGDLRVRVARHFDSESSDSGAVAISRTVANKVFQSGQPVVTTNAQEDPRFSGTQSIVSQALRSIMATPLRVRGQVIGVVYVDNRVRTGLFSEQDLDMLDAFAGQAGVAIENARLFGATDQALAIRVEELTMLQRIDRQLNETLDIAKAMNITLEWSSKVCKADSASMGLLDEEAGLLRVFARYGAADVFSQADTIPLDMPILRAVIEKQEPVLETTSGEITIKLLIVPVRRENSVIGIIALRAQSDNPAALFSDEDRALVTRMADRAAIAIENARLYGEVRAANLAKSEFVGIVAHELKGPMTSISGYADLMTIAGTVTERQAGFINTIKNAVYRMRVLVGDLTDISRIETGQLRVDLKVVSLPDAIAVARENTIIEIERRGHRLNSDVPADLPTVSADQDRMVQVMMNLMSNAYKYTPDGGKITVSAKVVGNRVAVAVADTGVGMTPDQVAKLGTKFWRAENGLQQQGTGLGFAITRRLIELMGGNIDIQSEAGKGTTIGFSLPIAAK
jgi:K+-sensing histidine kinase KdpD